MEAEEMVQKRFMLPGYMDISSKEWFKSDFAAG